jgi:hypothetical protein
MISSRMGFDSMLVSRFGRLLVGALILGALSLATSTAADSASQAVAGSPSGGVLFTVSETGHPESARQVRLDPTPVGVASATLALAAGRYVVTAVTAGWWALRDLEVPEGRGETQLTAWQTGEIRVPLSLPAGERPPAVRSHFQPCPSKQSQASEPAGFAEGTWQERIAVFHLPATCIDALIVTEHFAPVEFPAVTPTPRRPLSLRSAKLVPGGSLSGSVVSAVDGLGLTDVKVTLVGPERTGGTPRSDALRQLTQVTNVRGNFRFAGLARGRYELSAGGGSYGLVNLADLEVSPGHEKRVGNLEIGPAAAIKVTIDPARPPLDGNGWRVSLKLSSAPLKSIATGVADQRGEWVFKQLTAGSYLVQVEAPVGGSLVAVGETAATVAWGEEAPATISINACLVEGQVLLGEDGIPAHLSLGPPDGESGTMWDADSDEEGRFTTIVPRPGTYPVVITCEPRSVDTKAALKVKKCGDRPVVRVPATKVAGRAMWDDESGPAAGVNIAASRLSSPDQAPELPVLRQTNLKGEFVFVGLSEGSWALEAIGDGVSSTSVVANVEEKSATEDLALVVSKTTEVEGFVHDPSGTPLAAAVAGMWSGPTGSGYAESASDATGRFKLKLGTKATRIGVVAMPETGSWTTGSFAVREPLEIVIRPDSIQPTVTPLGGAWNADPRNFGWLLRRNGVYVSPSAVIGWAVQHRGWLSSYGAPMPLPPLAPGRWEICIATTPEEMAAVSRGDQLPCRSFEGLPGERPVLQLASFLN